MENDWYQKPTSTDLMIAIAIAATEIRVARSNIRRILNNGHFFASKEFSEKNADLVECLNQLESCNAILFGKLTDGSLII